MELNVEKINKFIKMVEKKSKETGIRVFSAIIALGGLGIGLMFSTGCGTAHAQELTQGEVCNEEDLAVTETPRPTSTPRPTVTPTVEPTASPTPRPELTYEQKRLLFEFDENFEKHDVGNIVVFNISSSYISGRVYCIRVARDDDRTKKDVFSISNKQYLFTIQLPMGATFITDYSKYLYEESAAFDNLRLVNSSAFSNMARNYDAWGIDYNDNEFLKDLSERYNSDPIGVEDITLTTDEIERVIIDSTPTDEIIPFWVYTPGATIPEELANIYSAEQYPPMPSVEATPKIK